MSSISDKSDKTKPKADYRLPPDGPHRYVRKNVSSEKEKTEEPSYVVTIVKREVENPQEKAQEYLNDRNLNSSEKDTLKKILEEPPKT